MICLFSMCALLGLCNFYIGVGPDVLCFLRPTESSTLLNRFAIAGAFWEEAPFFVNPEDDALQSLLDEHLVSNLIVDGCHITMISISVFPCNIAIIAGRLRPTTHRCFQDPWSDAG